MKNISVAIDNDGGIHVEFSGFEGRTCFDESDAFKRHLKKYGIATEELKVIETREEVETRKLDNEQRASHG